MIGAASSPAADPVAYASHGTHANYDAGYPDPTSDWANDGQVNFSGKACVTISTGAICGV